MQQLLGKCDVSSCLASKASGRERHGTEVLMSQRTIQTCQDFPRQLTVQPLSARCMRTLLLFRMGSHSLPVVLGRRTGVPRAQRLCQRCNLHAVHDERRLVFECPAMQCVRDWYPALLSPATNTMQLFMWQRNIVGVAHFVQDCFEVLGALDDAPDDASTSSSSALAAG